ncbi:MAG: DUF86 domain-containing protein [Cyanobacteria bacterium J06581_3]
MSNREEDVIRLKHMLEAAQQALQFTQGCSQEDLETDQMRSLAVVRLIEIIGEAAKSVSPELQSSASEIPWKQIKGTRDRVAHAYFDVDLDIIWSIVRNGLPPLVPNLEKLIEQQGK